MNKKLERMWKETVNIKFTLEQATKSQRGSKSTAVLFL